MKEMLGEELGDRLLPSLLPVVPGLRPRPWAQSCPPSPCINLHFCLNHPSLFLPVQPKVPTATSPQNRKSRNGSDGLGMCASHSAVNFSTNPALSDVDCGYQRERQSLQNETGMTQATGEGRPVTEHRRASFRREDAGQLKLGGELNATGVNQDEFSQNF